MLEVADLIAIFCISEVNFVNSSGFFQLKVFSKRFLGLKRNARFQNIKITQCNCCKLRYGCV